MSNSIVEKERKYCKEFSSLSEKLEDLYVDLLQDDIVDLEDNQVTLAVLERVVTYYRYQDRVKSFLNKRYATAGADFFVETLLFYLKVLICQYAPKYKIESERSIVRKRGSIRPDISIWKGDTVIAIIECKTQLGWNRLGWEADFIAREAKLKSVFPDARAFLFVMSLSNWPGFGNNKHLGEKYFVLTETWPGTIETWDSSLVKNSVETLFKNIINA